MQRQSPPKVEFISGPTAAPPPPPPPPKKSHRLRNFMLTLILCMLIGQGYNFARDPVYRTGATVLTVAPKGIDERSAEADLEHVSIQRSLLLSDEVVEAVRDALPAELFGDTLPKDLRQVLSVDPVPDTNLVELAAEGGDPVVLQVAVNTWVDAYIALRAARVAAATGRTTAALHEEQARLERKIATQRDVLERFRDSHRILSQERSENSALAELQSLRNSLETARQAAIDGRARVEAVEAAIARGEPVVLEEDRARMSDLLNQAAALRAQLSALDKRFTRAYLETDPQLKELPAQVAAMEQRVRQMKVSGREAVRAKVRQDMRAAEAAERELATRLSDQERIMAEFSARFAEYQTMERELAGLEQLLGENQDRLAQIDITNRERFPPLEVVDRAPLPLVPIRPDYWRDAGVIAGISVLIALFTAWLADYLTASPRPAPVTDIHIHGVASAGPTLTPPHETPPPNLADERLQQLAQLLPPEPDTELLRSALAAAPPATAAGLALLLSGVQPAELDEAGAAAAQGDPDVLEIGGRQLALAPAAKQLLAGAGAQRAAISEQAVSAGLIVVATDLGVVDSALLSPDAVHHSYVLYLVRQGARLSELAQQVGELPVDRLSQYAAHSPAGQNRPLAEISLQHPALAG